MAWITASLLFDAITGSLDCRSTKRLAPRLPMGSLLASEKLPVHG
jgi:hypothetical protein